MTLGFGRFRPALIFGLVALVIVAPALISSPMTHDSFWLDIVWTDQFTALLREGNIYPRWLPNSHDGLGSPVFYFYPPIAFYAAGLFGLFGLPAYHSVLAAFWLGLALSGLTMFHWLRPISQAPIRWSVLYMAMPYHMMNFYNRGALAECWAYAVIPLVALGVTRSMAGRGWIFLAVSYAALVMTHLPTAVLTSLFLVGPLIFVKAIRAPARIVTSGAAILWGFGLAALYLVTMTLLQPHASFEKMVSHPAFIAQNWSVLSGALWQQTGGLKPMMLSLTAVLMLMSILLAIKRQKWGYYALIMSIIVLGLVPMLWTIPVLAKLQFPWRGLLLVEFALVTAFSREHLGRLTITACVAALLSITSTLILSRAYRGPQTGTLATLLQKHPDASEYLPRGFTDEVGIYSPAAERFAALHREEVKKDGITVGTTFYFPAWRVMCSGKVRDVSRDPFTSLVTWRGDRCVPFITRTDAEKSGLAITILCLLGMIIGATPTLRARIARFVQGQVTIDRPVQ